MNWIGWGYLESDLNWPVIEIYKRINERGLSYEGMSLIIKILRSFVVEFDETHLGLDAVHDIFQIFLFTLFCIPFVLIQYLFSLLLLR